MRTISRQNTLAGIFLFLALFGVYSLSYSGVPAADDEQLFAAAAINAAENGMLSAEQLYGNSRLFGTMGGVEPLHSLAASWALRSGIFNAAGRMQALFWLNSFYTALTGLLLYGLVLQFGGSRKQALVSTIIYGFGTLAWPYAKTFFREPLAGLLLTLAVYLLVLGTKEGVIKKLRVAILTGAGLCFGAVLLTKVLLLAVLPALVLLVVLRMKEAKDAQQKEFWLAGGIALLVVLCLLLIGWAVLELRTPPRLTLEFFRLRYHNLITLPHDDFWLALVGIFVSPGKGLFFYMPIVLACIVGGFALRRRMPTLFWFPMLAVFALAVTQALVYDDDWWNMTWGTRFMLSVLPLMVLMGLPVLQWLEKRGSKSMWIALGSLFDLSAAIQLGAVLITDPVYLQGLYEQTLQPVTNLILWRLRYVPWVGHWRLVFQGGEIDLAMWRVFRHGNLWALAALAGLVLLVAGSAAALWQLEHKGAHRKMWITAGALSFAMLALMAVSMRLYRQDPAWHTGREDLAESVAFVEEQVQDGDGVVVAPYLYPVWYYAMNEAQFGRAWYSWPVPGDGEESSRAMEGFLPLADGYRRVWLIEEGADFSVEAQFREAFDLVETRRFGEDVWVTVFEVE
jgi:hypothetical protein